MPSEPRAVFMGRRSQGISPRAGVSIGVHMGDRYKELAAKRARTWRDVDVVEFALLLAFFLVGLTALIGKVHQMLF